MPAPSAPLSSFRIVADDLSGAADCAASFAAVAGPVKVVLGAGSAGGDSVALDTDSRAMSERDAVAAVSRVFGALPGPSQLVYKKIDSTLRGHVGAELAAALRAGAFAGAVVAPAFPDQGRTLAGGRLLVHGRPPDLGHSNDLMAMLDSAGLGPALLSPPFGEPALLARRIEAALQHGAKSIVVDAGRQQDLAMLAAALREVHASVLVAGSAGLARALAPSLPPAAAPVPALAAHPGGVLTVVGSFSAAAKAQVQQVERVGAAQVIRLTAPQWLDEQYDALRRSVAQEARIALARGGCVLFAVAGDVVQPFTRSLVVAMARIIAPLVQEAGTCVLTGGDTAQALFAQVGIMQLDVSGEFEPGISIGHAPAQPGRTFILKAGGFGDALALQRVIQHFGRAPS